MIAFALLLACDKSTPDEVEESVAPPPTWITVSGAFTNAFEPGPELQGQGYAANSNSYTFEGVQTTDKHWACPTCEVMVYGTWTVTATEGQTTVSPGDTGTGYLGWGDGGFFFSRRYNDKLLQTGLVAEADGVMTLSDGVDYEWQGWGYSYTVEGQLTLGETTEHDPTLGLAPPETYACGWPRTDAPEWEGPWTLEIGQRLPDGLFKDACDEMVRLHDFAGRYLIINASATDCGPCQYEASQANGVEDDFAARGVEVLHVTLMARSLGDTTTETPTEALERWVNRYELRGPVLADRGFGPGVMELEAYPTWVVVAPDLQVLATGIGADPEGVAQAIEAHAGL